MLSPWRQTEGFGFDFSWGGPIIPPEGWWAGASLEGKLRFVAVAFGGKQFFIGFPLEMCSEMSFPPWVTPFSPAIARPPYSALRTLPRFLPLAGQPGAEVRRANSGRRREELSYSSFHTHVVREEEGGGIIIYNCSDLVMLHRTDNCFP